jgi:hypothetical protein
MGIVLSLGSGLSGGGVEQPPYEVVETREGYTVRHYPPMIMAVAQANVGPDAEEKESELFWLLAGYIGVKGAPRNAQGRSVAMTAPVLTHVEGSGPAGLTRKSMAFILPRRFSRPEQAPAPTSPGVLIIAVPARTIAVERFSGTR